VVTILSGSENSGISIIKSITPMDTSLIFKEQERVKELRLREKGLAQLHYSIQQIEGYDLLFYKVNKQDLHSSIIEADDKEYCPCTMIYFIRDRQEQTKISGIP
jgi:hypothetical protein